MSLERKRVELTKYRIQKADRARGRHGPVAVGRGTATPGTSSAALAMFYMSRLTTDLCEARNGHDDSLGKYGGG